MKNSCFAAIVLVMGLVFAAPLDAARHSDGPLTPIRNSTTRGAYTIDTVGDTLNQASPQNTRLIIRVSGADGKMIKPDRIALIDKGGTTIEPVFREDRKIGHEENTGLPISVGGYRDSSGYSGTGVGINLNKVFGSKGDYAYTKVDWPKAVFASDKRLQIVMPGGQAFVLPLTSLAR